MKILLIGGGTGGHFYPLIAVTEAIREEIKRQKVIEPEVYYMAPDEYDARVLFDNRILFRKVSAGKVRRYFSVLNFIDLFKTAWGVFDAILQVFSVYPDVIFSKGGYASFPVLLAARIFKIPVVIHESDTVPGKVNLWSGKFAKKIALSYPEAAEYFPKDKVAFTGNPIRKEVRLPLKNGAHEFLGLDENVPTILIIGGSLGAQIINDTILDALPELVKSCQIIHQTGKNNFKEVSETANIVLKDSEFKARYKPFEYLNELAMRMSAGIAEVVVSRAGSAIFEIAAWGVPAIIIPIKESSGDHQRKNAFAYARSGAAIVIEEHNLGANILVSEIRRLMANPQAREQMKASAQGFAKLDAAEKIAQEVLHIALEHEK
jgi:UDP-N-acetylglucosamine--N-acetylmuramyl-(pentapeptide) pyrophosphoryl-undecaprenol N-acetylglucosamine transferase